MASYSGNKYGDLRLFVFSGTGGTNANFIISLAWDAGSTSITTDYVNAGGNTYGTTADLLPYVGNKAYLNFTRRRQSYVEQITPSGITYVSVDVTPDPRIQYGFIVQGTSGSFTGDFMDEIHVRTQGGTFQGFLGRLTYGAGSTALMDLVAYGTSGADIPNTAFSDILTGYTVENKTNGVGTTLAGTTVSSYIPLESYKTHIMSQSITASAGLTGVTIGVGTEVRTVKFYPHDKDLKDFIQFTLPVMRSTAVTGDPTRLSSIFTVYGFSGDAATAGLTLNGISGGTVSGTSELEEFCVKVGQRMLKLESDRSATVYTILQKNSIRAVDQVVF
jgi:hypothetical protein